ncbi:ABC transporter permease [Undibacterium pigrum]|uniref:Transport permease protein n=1 Tax=Undibacterium pigrum TaxID=401470 RepID=A0A318JGW7_9BURK|nr:ABC transporter permease [Undibacterium pigrum]PXX46629.1 lipopolysaccharide transport system permease protein [Undibacterium pigrum]
MNPHAVPSITPYSLLVSLKQHRRLILSLIQREVLIRYQGSLLGLLWSFFNPVLMLAVYTFVFSVVFKARWAGGSDSKTEFALVLFAGLMVFGLFSECVNRAPSLVVSNVNYVKKVIFPLEILPVVAMGAACFHLLISLTVWLIFYSIFFGVPPATIFYLPAVLLPLVLLSLGLSWLLASLGVFIRDIHQVVGVAISVLTFLSPVFYPIVALPEDFRAVVQVSPLTQVIEQSRDAMIWGKHLDWQSWLIYCMVSGVIAWLGFAWFQKTRKGFADVL